MKRKHRKKTPYVIFPTEFWFPCKLSPELIYNGIIDPFLWKTFFQKLEKKIQKNSKKTKITIFSLFFSGKKVPVSVPFLSIEKVNFFAERDKKKKSSLFFSFSHFFFFFSFFPFLRIFCFFVFCLLFVGLVWFLIFTGNWSIGTVNFWEDPPV